MERTEIPYMDMKRRFWPTRSPNFTHLLIIFFGVDKKKHFNKSKSKALYVLALKIQHVYEHMPFVYKKDKEDVSKNLRKWFEHTVLEFNGES